MIEKIQVIIDVLGVISCAVSAVCTGEMGYLVAAIWAATAFTTHVSNLND